MVSMDSAVSQVSKISKVEEPTVRAQGLGFRV